MIDIDKLEKVQRATKMVEGLEGYSYIGRLMILGLTTLETRFLRADLMEFFKILRGVAINTEKDQKRQKRTKIYLFIY